MKVFSRGTASEPGTSANDEGTLAELGYQQELKREWHVLHNFGVSFSIISVVGMHLRGAG